MVGGVAVALKQLKWNEMKTLPLHFFFLASAGCCRERQELVLRGGRMTGKGGRMTGRQKGKEVRRQEGMKGDEMEG